MPLVRTVVSVAGLREGEARDGLPRLLAAVRDHPRLSGAEPWWDAGESLLLVPVESDGGDADAASIFDAVWQCVLACFDCPSGRMHFDIEGPPPPPDP